MTAVLIGAGGHAKVVHEIAMQRNINFDGFIDSAVSNFKELKKCNETQIFKFYFLGIGGVLVRQLENRHSLYVIYKQKGACPLKLLSPQAFVSESAVVGDGTLVAHNAVIQTGATVGENVIIEHDAIIEDGCHIAPGAIILGGARVGSMSIVGAGAVVFPGQEVPTKTLVSSLTRYKND